MDESPLVLINSWLCSQGFKRIQDVNVYTYDGVFNCNNIEVPVRIEFSNVDFENPPVITLREPRPSQLKRALSHVDNKGELCYIDKEMVFLDRYKPVDTFKRLLATAHDVLTNSITGHNNNDIAIEFSSYWVMQAKGIYLSDEHNTHVEKYNILKFKSPTGDSHEIYVIGSDEAIANHRAIKNGQLLYSTNKNAIWLRMAKQPLLPQNGTWPPQSFQEFYSWLRSTDESCAKQLEKELGTKSHISIPLLVVLDTDGGIVSLEIRFSETYNDAAKSPGRFKKLVLSAKQNQGITLVRGLVSELSPKFITNRNLPSQDLSGRQIAVIGCGTIGGYLSRLLVQSGAGRGKNGRLILFDYQEFSPGNIGRHYLDESYLFDNKATACKHKLALEFPWINIHAVPGKYNTHIANDYDLIIDATGMESFSSSLNEAAINSSSHQKKITPILYVWIEGGGTSGRALFYDGTGGCYRCMRQQDGHDRFSPTSSENVTIIKYACGESFFLFPPSVSVHVASLGLDAALAWASGNPAPRLRFLRFSKTAFQYDDKNSLEPLNNCPACQS